MAKLEKYTTIIPEAKTAETAVAVLEEAGIEGTADLESALKQARKEQGKQASEEGGETIEEAELSPEKKGYMERMNSIATKFREAFGTALDYMVIKPAAWLRKKINEHPVLTAAIIVGVILAWYFSAPVALGASAMNEEALKVIEEVFKKSLEIDPGQVSDYLCTG